MQMPHSATCATEVQIFWPLSFQPPSTRSAFICSAARSEPAPGSQKSWHQIISPLSVAGQEAFLLLGRAVRGDGRHHPGPMIISGSLTCAASS